MKQEDIEMPEDYKEHLAQLTEMLEAREQFVKDAGRVPAEMRAEFNSQLRKFETAIDEAEAMLAEEHQRIQAERAQEAELSKKIGEGYETVKHLYIICKHDQPQLLDTFTEQVLGPMPDDVRQEFLDDVAILEATKLEAILKGEA